MRRAAEAFATRDAGLAASIDELDDLLDDLTIATSSTSSRMRVEANSIPNRRCNSLSWAGSTNASVITRESRRTDAYIIDGWLPEAQAAERARTRLVSDEPRSTRGLAAIDAIAEDRRIDAIRRDFVANVSHELKTPVGAISLLAETLVGETDPADRELSAMLQRGQTGGGHHR